MGLTRCYKTEVFLHLLFIRIVTSFYLPHRFFLSRFALYIVHSVAFVSCVSLKKVDDDECVTKRQNYCRLHGAFLSRKWSKMRCRTGLGGLIFQEGEEEPTSKGIRGKGEKMGMKCLCSIN